MLFTRARARRLSRHGIGPSSEGGGGVRPCEAEIRRIGQRLLADGTLPPLT